MYKNINLKVLYDLIEPLSEINNMIGLIDVKKKIIGQILYFVQGYHNMGKQCNACDNCELNITCMKNQSDMLHTVITGVPGTGKTILAKNIAKLYNKMGILESDKFVSVSRSDLIGRYLGETAIKTQQCIDKADGGVLFIDEAYSLGNSGNKDIYSKECIDTLTKNLSEKRTFICIIAGYKKSLDDCFFNHNEGLSRRFAFRYDLETYKYVELYKIFEQKINLGGFKISATDFNNEILNLFKRHEQTFVYGGGDMETLFLKTKLTHSRNINITQNDKYIISYNDINEGIQDMILHRDKHHPSYIM
jgi:SpoVK/Ycf46/Vps4 family AAA+-type ATPase